MPTLYTLGVLAMIAIYMLVGSPSSPAMSGETDSQRTPFKAPQSGRTQAPIFSEKSGF